MPALDDQRRRFLHRQRAGARAVRASCSARAPTTSRRCRRRATASRSPPPTCRWRAGRRILVLAEQFPSNVYTWRELRAAAGRRGRDRRAAGRMATGPRRCSRGSTSGSRSPPCRTATGPTAACSIWSAIGARCREVGSALVVDATQSLGALPLDLAAVRPDFLVCAGYKWLLGPYSLGYLYVAPQHQDGRPLEHNWIAREAARTSPAWSTIRTATSRARAASTSASAPTSRCCRSASSALEQLLAWGRPSDRRRRSRRAPRRSPSAPRRLGLSASPPQLRAGHYLGLRFPAGRARRPARAPGPGAGLRQPARRFACA